MIIIGRIPAAFARATASFASSRGGSIMPINPANTRSCSTRSSTSSASNAPAGSERKATPSVRSASPASSSLALQNLRAALLCQRLALFADQLLRTTREQYVRRALGEDEQALLALRIGMDRAHQLALGGERHFADALEARVERFILQAGFARRDDERAFGGVALHRPAAIALLQDGVVGPVADSERALQLDP